MTRIRIIGAMALVLAICLLPATSSADTVFNFTFDSAGSSGSVSGGILTFLAEDISTVAINGASYSGLTDELTVIATAISDTFSISGAFNGALADVSGTWLIFETQPSLATENGAGDFVVTYGNGTSLGSVSGALASNLGVAFTTGADQVSVGIGNGAVISPYGSVTSSVLSLMLSSSPTDTPEPSSYVMFVTGFFMIFVVGRRTVCGPPAFR